jgi:hypothetical protein
MSAAQIARDQIKDLQQQILEKDVALKGMQAKLDHYAEHATHAARCQLINEIKAAYVPYDKLTAEQVIELLCADKESSDAA